MKKTVVNILTRFLCFFLTKADARGSFNFLEAGLARCVAGARGGWLSLKAIPRSTSSYLLSFLTLKHSF
ncbi:MAG: hypothetical protein ABSA83_21030 [Verrucomicrobiota bacterium]